MKKMLTRIGVFLCFGGMLLGTIATVALFSQPADPIGAGELYDQQVEAYNKQMKEMADANPSLPAPTLGKTRLQAHRENAAFGLVVAGLMVGVGLVLYFRNRSGREQAVA
jgi:hypothetical protein